MLMKRPNGIGSGVLSIVAGESSPPEDRRADRRVPERNLRIHRRPMIAVRYCVGHWGGRGAAIPSKVADRKAADETSSGSGRPGSKLLGAEVESHPEGNLFDECRSGASSSSGPRNAQGCTWPLTAQCRASVRPTCPRRDSGAGEATRAGRVRVGWCSESPKPGRIKGKQVARLEAASGTPSLGWGDRSRPRRRGQWRYSVRDICGDGGAEEVVRDIVALRIGVHAGRRQASASRPTKSRRSWTSLKKSAG